MQKAAAKGGSVTCAIMLAAVAMPVTAGGMGGNEWIRLVDQTDIALDATPALGANDVEEKSYAWADLDQDGDVDLVVVRKQPWSTLGRRVNVIFMNEGGVLVDRTAEYASTSSVAGDEGFLTPTNDRDVTIADVNGDGWLDLVTAVTLSDDQPTEISHPRVYINLGEDRSGSWLGFRYEADRIPQFAAPPRFHDVAAGDVTGDGVPDLYFVYNRFGAPPPVQLHDRLLINDGTGYFADETEARMQPAMYETQVGTASSIVDINEDGANDIIKCAVALQPVGIRAAYNQPANIGHFDALQTVYQHVPTDFSVGELNNDGRLDLVVTDDNVDRYLLNQGTDDQGLAQFQAFLLPESPVGFGGESVIADLDADGWNDVIVTDVDFEIAGCQRVTGFYRNQGDGPTVTFSRNAGSVPEEDLTGVHHVAAFDITGNGSLDLVVGRCDGTSVYLAPTTGDLNFDGMVDIFDLLMLLGAWGDCTDPGNCPEDLNVDGTVDVFDLLVLLANWG